MQRLPPPENTGRVIGLAIAFFGGLAALGYVEGVFARLGPGTLAALAIFAVGFAALTCALDANVRQALRRTRGGAIRPPAGRAPAASPAAPSARRTSAPGSAAPRARAAG